MTQQKTWRAGRFWWDSSSPLGADVYPLRAVVFDLDALADVECEGHRVAYNAAFAAHGLDFEWSVTRYRQLLALSDERQRVSAELRKRGVSTESDVLTQLLADEIYATKTMMLDEMILDADLAPWPGLVDLVMDAFTAGVWVEVVSEAGQSRWCDNWSATGSSKRWSPPTTSRSPCRIPRPFKPHCGSSGYPRRTHSPSRVRLQGCGRRPPRVWPPWSSPVTVPRISPPLCRCARTTTAASRCTSPTANACTAVSGPGGRCHRPDLEAQPPWRSSSMTALKSLSAWSAANLA